MKRILLTFGLAAAPLAASAGVASEPYDFVDVEYWGRLDRCGGDCSDLPSVLHGRLEIDLSLASSDLSASPSFGHYGRPAHGFLAPGFVTSSHHRLLGYSGDIVLVGDLAPFNTEVYRVQNQASVTVDGRIVAEQRIEVGVSSLLQFGIEGDGLVQQFDVLTADVGGDGEGIVQELLDGVSRGYTFVVDRLRVTPRVCRP